MPIHRARRRLKRGVDLEAVVVDERMQQPPAAGEVGPGQRPAADHASAGIVLQPLQTPTKREQAGNPYLLDAERTRIVIGGDQPLAVTSPPDPLREHGAVAGVQHRDGIAAGARRPDHRPGPWTRSRTAASVSS